jgi:hypothetical protein
VKQDKITYRQTYENNCSFKPYTDKRGYISGRDLVLSADHWTSGSMILLEAYDHLWPKEKSKTLVRVESDFFHDRDYPNLAIEMEMLASQELRGRTAERVAGKIFWELVMLNPINGRKYLPIQHIKRMRELYPEVNAAWNS